MSSQGMSSRATLSQTGNLASISQQLQPGGSGDRKKAKLRAEETWKHAREPTSEEPRVQGRNRIFYCKYCENPTYGIASSSGFRNHLEKKHQIFVEEPTRKVETQTRVILQDYYDKAVLTQETAELDAKVYRKALNKTVINEALVSLIVSENLSFRFVESPEFHAFCRALNPEAKQYVLSSHSEISRKISNSFYNHQDILRRRLQSSLSKVHISLDIWTSPNKLLLLGICSHFVDYETESLSKALLSLPVVKSHSGEEQFSCLQQTLHDYDISAKLGAIISDNHGVNDRLCRYTSAYLSDSDINRNWEPEQNRIRCMGHIINLSVQAFLFGNNLVDDVHLAETDMLDHGPLKKLHNIIVHIRASPARFREFTTLASRAIPLDNSTRWNSWFHMIQTSLIKSS